MNRQKEAIGDRLLPAISLELIPKLSWSRDAQGVCELIQLTKPWQSRCNNYNLSAFIVWNDSAFQNTGF